MEDVPEEFEKVFKNKFWDIVESDKIESAFSNDYDKGFKAGQASRTPIKWPTQKEIEEAMQEYVGDTNREKFIIRMAAWGAGVEWLKSFVEKGQSK